MSSDAWIFSRLGDTMIALSLVHGLNPFPSADCQVACRRLDRPIQVNIETLIL